MRLALCLYRYTPFGGLEQNCRAIAEECVRRGHELIIFTRSWAGARPARLEVRELGTRGLTNIGRDRAFAGALARELVRADFDCVVGFNLLPALDVFYAADPCFLASRADRPWPVRAGRRHATRVAWERTLFAPGGSTELLVLSAREEQRYRTSYGTEPERLHVLPPGLRAEFLADGPLDAPGLRAELGIPADDWLCLAVGSDFERKGLDRSLRALAALPPELRERTWLCALGSGRPARFRRLARELGLGPRLHFLGGRPDVLPAYRGADLLLHPAREENTGTVLLEAMSQGLAVIASGTCGYAELVTRAGAGVALGEPFRQPELDETLRRLLADSEARHALGANGRRHARALDPRARLELAVDVIERAGARRRAALAQ